MIGISQRIGLKLAIGFACIALLALLVHDRNRWKAKTGHYAELLAGERAAHAATIANVRVAAAQSREADAANAARVRSEQASINERTEDDFESRISAARAAADRLRAKSQVGTGGRDGGATPMPGLPAAAARPAQGAREDRFSDPDRLTATEQAIQLDELIKWVRAQAAVEVSKD